MTALVREHLTENYPGQDMNQVANGFMRRCTKAQLPNVVSDRGMKSRSIFLLTGRFQRHHLLKTRTRLVTRLEKISLCQSK